MTLFGFPAASTPRRRRGSRAIAVAFLVAAVVTSASGCPQNLGSCKCFPSTVPGVKPILDCSLVLRPEEFKNIEGLQPGFAGNPPVFSQVVIRRSQLRQIPENAFGIAQADEYVIENNAALATVERNALGRNANPRVISIRNNPVLEVIQYEDFAQYSNLELLRLNDNRILEVPDYAFDGISRRLREIHLERNIILDIGPFAFRGLPSLLLLNLAENQISEVPTAALFFSSPPDLVDLSDNKIVTIDRDAFSDPAFPSRGAYAKHVDIRNNDISVLDRSEWENVFNQMDRLEKLFNAPTTQPPPPTFSFELSTTTTTPFPSPSITTPTPPTNIPIVDPVVVSQQAPPQPPAAPAVPNTENLLLKILEKLQLLTGNNNQLAQTPAPVAAPIPMARALQFPLSPPVQQLAEVPAPAVEPSSEPAPETTMPPHPVTETEPAPVVDTTAAPSEAPAVPNAEPAGGAPPAVAAPTALGAEADLVAFGPFWKIREELLAAIRTNPAAAVAAASAVQAAAKAAAQAATPTPVEPILSVRRKRQSILNSVPIPPAKEFTMDFAGNPIMCDCEAKWVYDFRHRYEDQLQNVNCLETRESIFKLHFGHFRRC